MSIPDMFNPVVAPLQVRSRPYVRIIEQPSGLLRFRYGCEKRPAKIPGVSSTGDNKIPVAIQIVGYEGPVVIVVSCVTKELPYRPHPHSLIGQNCRKGVCTFETEITASNSVVKFTKLAVQCVKRNQVFEALTVREEKKVDPFLTGFDHKNDLKSFDLNAVRLCFQVFLMRENREMTETLTPVVSNWIYNKKTTPDPLIYRLSHCTSLVSGSDDDIILLCTKIMKDDITIRFFETRNDQLLWEDYGTFHPNHVYNNSAICFRPPKYHDQNIVAPRRVSVQLVRPSDGTASPVVEFEFLPRQAAPTFCKETRLQGNAFWAQLIQMEAVPVKVPRMEFGFQELPPIGDLLGVSSASNDINQTQPSEASKNSTHGLSNWNITSDDLAIGTDVNIDSATGICQVLNINNIDLQPIHLSSGDLEMTSVEQLSGSFQGNLVI